MHHAECHPDTWFTDMKVEGDCSGHDWFCVRVASDFRYVASANFFQLTLVQNIGCYEVRVIASVKDASGWSHIRRIEFDEDGYLVVSTFVEQ